MADHLGSFNVASTRTHVGFQFTTHDATGANVAPSSAFENSDLRIYKATDSAAFSATQRSSASGITMTSPFDTLTGVHDVDIDLTDNTDAGFYATNCRYAIVLSPDETIDSVSVTRVLAYFDTYPSQTGDSFARIGATGSGLTSLAQASVATEARLAELDAANLPTDVAPATLRSAIGLAAANLDTQLGDIPTNAELATALAAADDAVLAAIAALNNLSQADIRSAIGLASANLDTQLDALPTNAELATALGTADDAILAAIAALNNLSSAAAQSAAEAALAVYNAAQPGDEMILSSAYDFAKGTVVAIEDYAANNAACTPIELLYMIYSVVAQSIVSGTAINTKKLDGSTNSMVFTTDSATEPTQRLRTS